MKFYFVARHEASLRQFNRRSVSARSVLRSNQSATVCLRPFYRQITVSLFYRRYHRTAIRIMIKLVRLTAWSSHVCRHPARPPDDLLVSYYPTTRHMQCCRPSIHPYARLAVATLVAAPSASRPRCSRLPSIARSLLPGRFSDSRRDAAAIDCPLFPRSRVDVSGGHVSTCCLMKMASASSLDCICMVCS